MWYNILKPILRDRFKCIDRRGWKIGPGFMGMGFLRSPVLPFITRRKALHYAFDEYQRGRDEAGMAVLPGVAKQFYYDGWNACRDQGLSFLDDFLRDYGGK